MHYNDFYSKIINDKTSANISFYYLNKIRESIEKCENILKYLEELFTIKWIPLPLDIESDTEINYSNKEIPENTLRIIYNDLLNNQTRFLNLNLANNKNIKLGKKKMEKYQNKLIG